MATDLPLYWKLSVVPCEIETHDKLETGSFYSDVCMVTNFITVRNTCRHNLKLS